MFMTRVLEFIELGLRFCLCCCFLGLSFEQALEFAKKMEFSSACQEQAADYFVKLYNIFSERDATLLEINPMSEDLMGRGMIG